MEDAESNLEILQMLLLTLVQYLGSCFDCKATFNTNTKGVLIILYSFSFR